MDIAEVSTKAKPAQMSSAWSPARERRHVRSIPSSPNAAITPCEDACCCTIEHAWLSSSRTAPVVELSTTSLDVPSTTSSCDLSVVVRVPMPTSVSRATQHCKRLAMSYASTAPLSLAKNIFGRLAHSAATEPMPSPSA